MQPVITMKEAKQITRGRTPLVPVEYEEAIKDLIACQNIDDAKYWSDKADALAAWAKMYRDDKASVEAKRLKLHAFNRMGELAKELRPKKSAGFGKGSLPGARSMLVEKGLTYSQAAIATKLGSSSKEEFESIVNLPRPPSPSIAVNFYLGNTSKERRSLITSMATFKGYVLKVSARDMAKETDPRFSAQLRETAICLIEWLDEFERNLPVTVEGEK